MAEVKRTYKKGSPERDLLPQQKKKTVIHKFSVIITAVIIYQWEAEYSS
jgi:hypothetical protein